MIMNKLKKAVVMVLALAMVLTCAMVTPVQAAGKLNKKSVSIYETETVSLTGKGCKERHLYCYSKGYKDKSCIFM